MSQVAARPLPHATPRRAPGSRARADLRAVPAPERDGSGAFLALCIALMLGGFVLVLILNTSMAKGSYVLSDLQRQSDALTDAADDLQHTVDAVSGPGPLAKQARALGMVPAPSAAFLRLSDGAVIGVAEPAKANEDFTVVTETQLAGDSAATSSSPPSAVPEPTAADATTPTP